MLAESRQLNATQFGSSRVGRAIFGAIHRKLIGICRSDSHVQSAAFGPALAHRTALGPAAAFGAKSGLDGCTWTATPSSSSNAARTRRVA